MKNIITTILLFFTVSLAFSQPKKQEIKIMTSAECGMCKDVIEAKLNYTKGIIFADLNYESKELTVKFNSSKIKIEEIRKIISELGYDADDFKANSEAQSKLPACCLPGGMKTN
jgi:periplasmic mercuric ion binding protein